MDSPVAEQNRAPPDPSASAGLEMVEIAPDGDLVLDVTFETSKETLRAARKANNRPRPRPGHQKAQATAPPILKPRLRLGYRVQLSVLKRHSKYFTNLLGDTRFTEARSIAAALERLALRDIKPSEAAAADLPRVEIHEDDEASQSADQGAVFGDLLRILHAKEPLATKPVTMPYLATLALLADRFDCAAPVSRSLGTSLKFKWPATQARLSSREDGGGPVLAKGVEETLRQKILVSWLLDQPVKMLAATRELIVYGSRRWSAASPDEEEPPGGMDISSAAWWNLPDDLEGELQYRRECILNAIASVQRHFLRGYTGRKRQCTLGYDSSSSCDAFQLGEMVKFLVGHNLLFLADFSSSSPGSSLGGDDGDDAAVRDYAAVDVGHIISVLKQCPAYQIDKNHTNCGLRTRILPIMDFIQAMLSCNVVPISRPAWQRDRGSASWCPSEEGSEPDGRGREKKKVFRFTRSMAVDQRLRYEGAMAADRVAISLFTADQWDWTPED